MNSPPTEARTRSGRGGLQPEKTEILNSQLSTLNSKALALGLKEGDVAVSLSVLSEPALAPRAVFTALREMGIYADVERRHIDIILNFARDGQNGGVLDMPGGLKVRKEHGRIVFRCTKHNRD